MENNEEKQEQKALPEGFISKEEWVAKGRNVDEWRDPEEFERRGEEILPIVKKNLEDIRQENKELRSDIEKISEFNKRQEERIREEERKKIQEEYEKKRESAVENSDVAALKEAETERDKKVKELTEVPGDKKNTETDDNWDKTFSSWKEKNTWYEEDKELQAWADEDGKGILQVKMMGGMTPEAALDYVAEDAKKRFPHKFNNPNRENASDVETEGRISSGKVKMDKISDISDNEKRKLARKSFVRIKEQMKVKGRDYTEKDYMSNYNA